MKKYIDYFFNKSHSIIDVIVILLIMHFIDSFFLTIASFCVWIILAAEFDKWRAKNVKD